MRWYFSLLGRSLFGYAYAQILAMTTQSHILIPYLSFQDDNNINHLILTYLETILRKKFHE